MQQLVEINNNKLHFDYAFKNFYYWVLLGSPEALWFSGLSTQDQAARVRSQAWS